MSLDLILVHIIFIVVMASVSYLWGEADGRKKGQQDMGIDMLDRRLVTQEQLKREYID